MNGLIYLKTCFSTNDQVLSFLASRSLGSCAVYTFNQTKGRGQYGKVWQSSADENIAFSMAIPVKNIQLSPNLFNYYTAIILRNFIAKITLLDVLVKWPNDFILQNKKIGGMLIEKKTANQEEYYIIGFGLNVLQVDFGNISNASSLHNCTLRNYDLEHTALILHKHLLDHLFIPKTNAEILKTYNQHLFKIEKISVFEKDNIRQNGIIKNADENGFLWIDLENDGLQKFYHQEIKLLY